MVGVVVVVAVGVRLVLKRRERRRLAVELRAIDAVAPPDDPARDPAVPDGARTGAPDADNPEA